MHKFLIHKRGDHVGVATSDIASGEKVIGVYMDDDSTIELKANSTIPLGHKIAIVDLAVKNSVIEYGLPVGYAPEGFNIGDYVHTHNMKTLRW
jgi:(2R)-sulfolactate sulfo-lyase subunit alpha